MKYRLWLLSLAVANCVCGPAWAETFQQALVQAYETNPDLQAERAKLREVDEQVSQAESNWRPSVDATGAIGKTYQDINDPATAPIPSLSSSLVPKSAGVQVTEPLFRGFRTVAATSAAEKKVAAERANLEAVEEKLFLDAGTAYLDVLHDQALVELDRNNEDVLRQEQDAVDQRYGAGELTQTDVHQARSRLKRAEADRIQAEGDLSNHKTTYAHLIGQMPGALQQPELELDELKNLDEATVLANKQNPNVLAATYGEDEAKEEVTLNKGSLLPEVDLVGSKQRQWDQSTYIPGQQDTSQIMVQVTIPLYRSGTDYSKTRAAQHAVTERRMQLEEARRQAHEDAMSAWQNLITARGSRMQPSSETGQIPNTGGAALVLLLRFHGIAVDLQQLVHKFGGGAIGIPEMLRSAKELHLKARSMTSDWSRLADTPMPAIAERRDGSFFILAKISDDGALVQDPAVGRPQILKRAAFEDQWSGRLVLMTRRAGLGELTRRFDITWFLQAMHKYRRLLSEVLVASFFLQLFALISPLFFQVVIDKVLVHRGLTTLDVLIIGLVTVSIFESVLTALRTYVFSHTTSRIDVELGARLFRHLVALPIAYFEARRAGDSVARVRELENIRNFLTSSALTLLIDLFFTFVFLGVMAYYSLFLTGIVLASFPFYIAISLAVTPVFRQRLDDKFNRGAENQSFLVESVTGIETLKAMAVEPQMQRRWEEQLAGYVRASFRVLNLGNWSSQGVQLVSKLVTAAVLFFGAKAVIEGNLTVGQLVAFNMLAGRVAQPVLRLAQVWQDFHQARLSVARLGDILNTHPEPSFTPGRTALPAIKGNISFEHVTFRYRIDGPVVLHDIDIDIESGQVIGVVGPSGSGKSTLAKLVQRFYIPESGRVLIDGVDLAQVDVAWLRRQVGVVLQENVLFNRSIRDNIALTDPGIPTERVIQAAKLAGAHDFILELPQGYDTGVGERGASLSGGQRQRIAIARALITDPRILIFDEATSALDYESERVIQDNMRQIVKGRTVLIIAHRLSAVRHCHRIITIDKGFIVEDGSHDDLVKSGGRYASLYNLQGGLRAASA